MQQLFRPHGDYDSTEDKVLSLRAGEQLVLLDDRYEKYYVMAHQNGGRRGLVEKVFVFPATERELSEYEAVLVEEECLSSGRIQNRSSDNHIVGTIEIKRGLSRPFGIVAVEGRDDLRPYIQVKDYRLNGSNQRVFKLAYSFGKRNEGVLEITDLECRRFLRNFEDHLPIEYFGKIMLTDRSDFKLNENAIITACDLCFKKVYSISKYDAIIETLLFLGQRKLVKLNYNRGEPAYFAASYGISLKYIKNIAFKLLHIMGDFVVEFSFAGCSVDDDKKLAEVLKKPLEIIEIDVIINDKKRANRGNCDVYSRSGGNDSVKSKNFIFPYKSSSNTFTRRRSKSFDMPEAETKPRYSTPEMKARMKKMGFSYEDEDSDRPPTLPPKGENLRMGSHNFEHTEGLGSNTFTRRRSKSFDTPLVDTTSRFNTTIISRNAGNHEDIVSNDSGYFVENLPNRLPETPENRNVGSFSMTRTRSQSDPDVTSEILNSYFDNTPPPPPPLNAATLGRTVHGDNSNMARQRSRSCFAPKGISSYVVVEELKEFPDGWYFKFLYKPPFGTEESVLKSYNETVAFLDDNSKCSDLISGNFRLPETLPTDDTNRKLKVLCQTCFHRLQPSDDIYLELSLFMKRLKPAEVTVFEQIGEVENRKLAFEDVYRTDLPLKALKENILTKCQLDPQCFDLLLFYWHDLGKCKVWKEMSSDDNVKSAFNIYNNLIIKAIITKISRRDRFARALASFSTLGR